MSATDTAAAPVALDSVFARFERQAAATPQRLAVLAEAGDASYAALARRAAEVCTGLLAHGVDVEEPVGVWLHRDADLPAALLGVWQAGGAWVPFDPQDPPARVLRLLALCGAKRVVGHGDLLATLRQAGAAQGLATPALIDIATLVQSVGAAAAPSRAAGGDRLAYLLFTSGSSGEPKAVEVEQRSVLNLLQATQELIGFGAADRYLATSTIGFDIAVAEIFLPLITGGSLLLRDRQALLEPARLAQDLRRFGVSVMQTGPSVWQLLLAQASDFPKLRVAISTGEAIAPDLAQQLAAYAEQAWNLYGPTETTVWATAHALDAAAALDASATSAPIGRPLAGMQAIVVDDAGRAVADGQSGELLIGGAGVARGYRGNAALTEERFIDLGPGLGRFYRSGDLVRRDASGVLHYLGRNDEQLKIRGVRVEPGEVEAALRSDARVLQAAATWYDTGNGSRAVVAAVVAQPGRRLDSGELHGALQTLLPAQMIPARFLFVPWLPMTANGKVDRQAIRAAATSQPLDPPMTPPPALTETERLLAGIWQRMLGLDQVAPDDHFLSIGGDSLAAVQMMVEAEALFGVELPVHTPFETPTLAQMARRIDAARQRPATLNNADFVYPLVEMPGQRPLFFCDVNLNVARRGAWTVPCPLYAISAWARGSGFVQAESLTALAAAYLDGIRRVQARGPYRIAGFSKGGLVAFELAQQLKRQGEQVELLFLLEPTHPRKTNAPASAPNWPVKHTGLAQRALGRWRRIVQGPRARGFKPWLQDVVPYTRFPPYQWLVYHLVHLYGRRPNPVSQMLLPRNRWPAFWFAAKRQIKDYVAQPYDGPVLAVFGREDYSAGGAWPDLLGAQAQVHVLPSTHLTIFDEADRQPWMKLLAASLASQG